MGFLLMACINRNPEMVFIPSGEFIMGSDIQDFQQEGLQYGFPTPWYVDEHPARNVTLPRYYIDRYEATNREYKRFTDATGHRVPAGWIEQTYPVEKGEHPVVHVDWYDADTYCRWAGKRLPTEEEWEKAARGTDGRLYPWGNTFDPKHANISTAPEISGQAFSVNRGETSESPYGVEGLIGNVWEWTDSWYLPYAGNKNFNENYGMKSRVVRGLSFNTLGHYPKKAYPEILAVFARASARGYEPPTMLLEDLGVRCAKSD